MVFILFSTLIYAKPQSTGNVKIVNNELYVNGKSFIIKGITYQPTPIGEDVRYGYNLSNHPELWHRDFPLLREMNANTIRTWAKVTNSDFLDDAYNNGSKPIYVLMGYWMNVYVDNYSNPTTRSYYINDFRNYVATYKNYSAVLMWAIGNEDNLHYSGDISDWYSLANEMAQAAYNEEGSSYHPVIIVNGEINNIGNLVIGTDDSSLSYIDAWGANVYRGYSFGNLFNDYKTKTNKTLIITEYGIDAWHTDNISNSSNGYEDNITQAEWDIHLWNEIKSNISNGVLGGTLMAYSDEWWKAENPSSHDYGGYYTSWNLNAQPDSFSNEEWWGIMSIKDNGTSPDIMQPRKVYYDLKKEFYEPTDEEFLRELLNDTYNYFITMEQVHGNGLPENWLKANGTTGSYLSPEETGFYMLSHIGAYENGLINLQTAIGRINKTLVTLENLDKYKKEIGVIWRIGDDEAPPDYTPTAFDEFNQSDSCDGTFYIGKDPINHFPKHTNDWSCTSTTIYFNLTAAQANKSAILYLDTLYASHSLPNGTYLNYCGLNVNVNNNNLGNFNFSSTGPYPEARYILLNKTYLKQGQNNITIKNAHPLYSGYWVVWDSLKLLSNLEDLGLFYRFYNTNSLVPTDTNVPSIGNAMLAASLITINNWATSKGYYGLANSTSYIVDKINLSFFWNDSSKLFYHDLRKLGYWDFYSDEGRLLSFVAYALGAIKEEQFRDNLNTLNQTRLCYDNVTASTSACAFDYNQIIVNKTSWDGSMFTYLVPSLFIQEHLTNYKTLTSNPAVHSQISYAQRQEYKLDGKNVWGISDSFNSWGFYCSEFQGAPPTKAAMYGNSYEVCPGLITPHASALALITDYSQEAIDNLQILKGYDGLYNETYGFKDSAYAAYGSAGQVADRILTLDQEWIFLSLMNYLNETVWKYFYKEDGVKKAHFLMYEGEIFTINLTQGWNLISFPINLTNKSVSSIFTPPYKVFTYINKWVELNADSQINENRGYWVKVNTNQTLEIEGIEIANPNFNLNPSWNLVSHRSLDEIPIKQTAINNSIVYTYNGSWLTYYPNRAFNSLSTLKPGYGYWVKVS